MFTGYVEASVTNGGISQPNKWHGGEHPMWLVMGRGTLTNDRYSQFGAGGVDNFFDFWLPFISNEIRRQVGVRRVGRGLERACA